VIFVETDPFLALEKIKTQLQLPFYMDIIILFFFWSIWMQRNDYIFKGVSPSSEKVSLELQERIYSCYPPSKGEMERCNVGMDRNTCN